MTFLWPLSLLGLIAVAAVAAWALFRPARQLAVVGSLELWRTALATLTRASAPRSRLLSASWLALLAGAVAMCLATARPAYYSQSPRRTIAVAVYPSAELAGTGGMDAMRRTAEALLNRLDPADRVQLILPDVLDGAGEFLSPREALAKINSLAALPIAGYDLTLPQPGTVQHLYRFIPAGMDASTGPNVSVVAIPASLPQVTFDAVGAEELADGQAQIFVALRNQTAGPITAQLSSRTFDDSGRPGPQTSRNVTIAPHQRQAAVWQMPAFAGLALRLSVGGEAVGGPGGAAFLARRSAARSKVAMLGPDEPLVRRFVQKNPGLELVALPKDADFVIASVVQPPADKPALVIHPSRLPNGWSRGQAMENFEMAKADLAVDPIMADVNLNGAIVRRIEPWAATGEPSEVRLVAIDGQGVVLRNASGDGHIPKRVYVAFDLSASNTNFGMMPSFVTFLGNATEYLAPAGGSAVKYEFVVPSQVGQPLGWAALAAGDGADLGPAGRLPMPGLYRTATGRLEAVSLVGLVGASTPTDIKDAVASLTLPPAEYERRAVEFWPALAAAAMAFWLAGWWLRAK